MVAAQQASEYFRQLENSLALLQEEDLPGIHQAAAAVAGKLAAGGSLFVYDSIGSFTSEATGRAGGLTDISRVRHAADAERRLSADGVLIVGARSAADPEAAEVARVAKEANALVIAVCPAGAGLPDVADFFLNDRAPGDGGVVHLPSLSSPVCPTVGVLNTVVLWALVAQTVKELIERGHVPRVWKSIQLHGSSDYNRNTRSDPPLKPITVASRGRISRDRAAEYLSKARRVLSDIRAEEMHKIAEVASLAAATILQGNAAFHFDVGHMSPGETRPERAGNPRVFKEGEGWLAAETLEEVGPADFVLWGSVLGGQKAEVPAVRGLHARGVKIACIYDPSSPEQAIREDPSGQTVSDFAVTVIEGHYPVADGCLSFDEMAVPVCPLSGFVNFSVYWAIAAQTAANLLAAGAALPGAG